MILYVWLCVKVITCHVTLISLMLVAIFLCCSNSISILNKGDSSNSETTNLTGTG